MKYCLCERLHEKDLRLKVLLAIDGRIPRKEVADLFGISLSTIKRWLKRRHRDFP